MAEVNAAVAALVPTLKPDSKMTIIHYSKMPELAWCKIGLDDSLACSRTGTPVGIEMVLQIVSSMFQATGRLTNTKNNCYFCKVSLEIGNENLAYMYRPVCLEGSTRNFAHVMVMLYFCSNPSCAGQGEMWQQSLIATPTPKAVTQCAACSKTSKPGFPFVACNKCGLVRYCSDVCQMEHWASIHGHFCKVYGGSKE